MIILGLIYFYIPNRAIGLLTKKHAGPHRDLDTVLLVQERMSFIAMLVPLLMLAGLPFGFCAYLLDRRLLGPAAVAFFPEAVPLAPPVPEPVASEPAASEPSAAPLPSAPLPARSRSAPVPFVGLAPLGPLLAALALAPVWAYVVNGAGQALGPAGTFPGLPELTAIFDEVAARQEEHRARFGSYARTLGALEALPIDVRGGLTQGYVLRYARLGATRWVLAADPVPARPGWPSLRLVGPDGQLDRGTGPFLLEAEEP